MAGPTVVRASAPTRLDFAGGWTDVAPYASERGGIVVNAAIDLRARAAVAPGGESWVMVAEDLGREDVASTFDELRAFGTLPLLRAGLRLSGIGPCALRTRADAPPGSGLGSSGAMGVAIVAALDAALGAERSPTEIAEEAWRLEAVEADLAGGRQDQYGAALGGFNELRFQEDRSVVKRITVDPATRRALRAHIIACYTGISRVSSTMIARVMGGYRRGERRILEALDGIANVADRMAEALVSGDLARVGRLLSANWEYQMALDPNMCTGEMHRLEAVLKDAGSLGGKGAGAGAGGSMFFVVADPARALRAVQESGATVLAWEWSTEGVRVEA